MNTFDIQALKLVRLYTKPEMHTTALRIIDKHYKSIDVCTDQDLDELKADIEREYRNEKTKLLRTRSITPKSV